jgi:hypothetical protein
VLFSFDPESELAQGKGKLKKAAFLRSKKVLSSTARLSQRIMKSSCRGHKTKRE